MGEVAHYIFPQVLAETQVVSLSIGIYHTLRELLFHSNIGHFSANLLLTS